MTVTPLPVSRRTRSTPPTRPAHRAPSVPPGRPPAPARLAARPRRPVRGGLPAHRHHRDPQTWAWPWSGAAHQAIGTDLFPWTCFGRAVRAGPVAARRARLRRRAGGRPGQVLLMRRMARLPLYYVIVPGRVGDDDAVALPGHWRFLGDGT